MLKKKKKGFVNTVYKVKGDESKHSVNYQDINLLSSGGLCHCFCACKCALCLRRTYLFKDYHRCFDSRQELACNLLSWSVRKLDVF